MEEGGVFIIQRPDHIVLSLNRAMASRLVECLDEFSELEPELYTFREKLRARVAPRRKLRADSRHRSVYDEETYDDQPDEFEGRG